MNAKDVENLGYIMSICKTRQELVDKICELDPRIPEEYEAFEMVQGRSDAVNELFDKKLKLIDGEHFGWKKMTPERKVFLKELMVECRKEIYGDDYDPSFFA